MAKKAKTSFSIDPDLLRLVNHKCIDMGISASAALEVALNQWLSGKSATQPSTKDGDGPTNESGNNSGASEALDGLGKTLNNIGLPHPFLGKMESLLQSVPRNLVPVLERFILQHAERAIHLLEAGVQYEQQRAANPPDTVHFEELADLHDKPARTKHIPTKSA